MILPRLQALGQNMATYQVFDGHNDVMLRLWKGGADHAASSFRRSETGHIDLEKAATGNLVGGFFALFAPPGGGFTMPAFIPPYDVTLPPQMDQAEALQIISEQAGLMHRLDGEGLLSVCRNRADIDTARAAGRMAAIMHLEGCEALDPDLVALDLLYAAGLRSLGPVWSRPTIFGHGVPFRFPSDGDIGPGLTREGKALVRRCATLGVIVDTSHLNVRGFWDVADAGLPLVATHSNAHSVSPGARNLTDAQLRAIGETGGMVGLNFATMFLREDGRAKPQGARDAALRHLDHMIALAGEDHVGFGSDFDGAPMPVGLKHAGDLPDFLDAIERHGFGAALITKIAMGNWLAYLSRALG